MMQQIRRRTKAWPRHTPGKKETSPISPKNRVQPLAATEKSFLDRRPIPLKRKYLTMRAYMQAPVGSPAQPARKVKRSHFPISRQRAIKSPLAG